MSEQLQLDMDTIVAVRKLSYLPSMTLIYIIHLFAAANPSFTDGVATKDIHIDPLTSLALRIFLPDSCHDSAFKSQSIKSRAKDIRPFDYSDPRSDPNHLLLRRNSYGSANGVTTTTPTVTIRNQNHRRNSYGCSSDDVNLKSDNGVYEGYNGVTRPAGDWWSNHHYQLKRQDCTFFF